MQKINGRAIAHNIRTEVSELITKTGITPGLSVILVGDNPSSHLYVNIKEKAARDIGINFSKYVYDEDAVEEDILTQIRILNFDPKTHAIIVQLPLPKKFNQFKIISTIDPKKDVDGFHPANVHAFLKGEASITPVLVKAIRSIIADQDLTAKQKRAVILANSTTFADPTRVFLERSGFHVNMYAPTPQTIPPLKDADLVISALGRAHELQGSMFKQGAVIIDIGISKTSEGIVVGDVDLQSCENVDCFVTPVPGGVGPVTVAHLLSNAFELASAQLSYEMDSTFGF